jgi:hypothetical protein
LLRFYQRGEGFYWGHDCTGNNGAERVPIVAITWELVVVRQSFVYLLQQLEAGFGGHC